jgi:hypothetical protein
LRAELRAARSAEARRRGLLSADGVEESPSDDEHDVAAVQAAVKMAHDDLLVPPPSRARSSCCRTACSDSFACARVCVAQRDERGAAEALEVERRKMEADLRKRLRAREQVRRGHAGARDTM